MEITWVPSPDYKHHIASCLNFRYYASQHGLFNVYFKKNALKQAKIMSPILQ